MPGDFFVKEQEKKLLKQKKDLEQQLKDLRAKRKKGKGFLVKFPIYGRDVDSDIQEVQDYSGNLSREKELSNFLREIKMSLRLIKKNRYGICVVCHKPISKARLKAFPAAITHAHCKKPIRFWNKFWPFKKVTRRK